MERGNKWGIKQISTVRILLWARRRNGKPRSKEKDTANSNPTLQSDNQSMDTTATKEPVFYYRLVYGHRIGLAWHRHNLAMRPTTEQNAFITYLDGHPTIPLTQKDCFFDKRYDLWRVTEKAYRQIEQLCDSPHWYTLIKAHYARKEND